MAIPVIAMKFKLIHDFTGQRFNRLTALEQPDNRTWRCRCDCGAIKIVNTTNLRLGKTQSCGCLRTDRNRERRKNRLRDKAEYSAWCKAKERCFNKHCRGYKDYGGRGITMWPGWVNSFPAFLEHVGKKPEGTSLDRIDNNKGYEPGNLRWATRKEQVNNRRIKRIENFSDAEIFSEYMKRFT